MTTKDIEIAIRNGEIIVTTKNIIREAVKQAVSGLYDEVSGFEKNRYKTARDTDFSLLSEQQQIDIANDVIDYIIRND